MITGWSAEAFNQEPNSSNEIHGDALAQAYGFEGGLVPGVTISAYLTHPAVEAWGVDFLARGYTHVRVVSPLYDGETFRVRIDGQAATGYTASLLRPDGTVCAHAEVRLEGEPPVPPPRRGDPLAPEGWIAPRASREHFETLRATGCRALRHRWQTDCTMGTYLRDRARMPALLRGEHACANMSYLLGMSNWIADGNAHMNPWVHLETHSQNYAPVPAGTPVIAEMTIADLFERKGHEFFDADVNLFDERDDNCLATIKLRAIYHLRGAPAAGDDRSRARC